MFPAMKIDVIKSYFSLDNYRVIFLQSRLKLIQFEMTCQIRLVVKLSGFVIGGNVQVSLRINGEFHRD